MSQNIDDIKIAFSDDNLWILFIVLGFIMFGVALQLKLDNFTRLLKKPRALITGIFSQFVLLPALTFCVVWVLNPQPGIALGMFLVAACPGGNISNFISSMAKANAELSVTLTAFATVLAVFLTPLNFSLWAGLYQPTSELMKEIAIQPWDMFKTVLLLLGIPIALGMFLSHKFPVFINKVIKPVKIASLIIFAAFVTMAFVKNYDVFINYIHVIVLLVFAHNAVGLSGGYFAGKLARLTQRNCRAISIETGMQNSGLALGLVFAFFDGLGGMALIAAWWGIWHIISGLALAFFWSKKGIKE